MGTMALYTDRMEEILDVVDGAQFSLHAEATSSDIYDFEAFQMLLIRRTGSYRAYISQEIEHSIAILPAVWTRVKLGKQSWLTEDELLAKQPGGLPVGLPVGEDLVFFDGAAMK